MPRLSLLENSWCLQCSRVAALNDFPREERFLRRAVGDRDKLAGVQRHLVLLDTVLSGAKAVDARAQGIPTAHHHYAFQRRGVIRSVPSDQTGQRRRNEQRPRSEQQLGSRPQKAPAFPAMDSFFMSKLDCRSFMTAASGFSMGVEDRHHGSVIVCHVCLSLWVRVSVLSCMLARYWASNSRFAMECYPIGFSPWGVHPMARMGFRCLLSPMLDEHDLWAEEQTTLELGLDRPRKPRRILAVDDDAIVRQIIARTLTRSGYTVDLAVDGAAGWEALSAVRYDLLITDYNMPKVSGVELLKVVRLLL